MALEVLRAVGVDTGGSNVQFAVNPVNDAPIAVDDNYVVDEGALLAADDADGSVPGTNDDGVLVNDTDAEFEVLTAELVDAPLHHAGAFVLNADGTFSYTHDGLSTSPDSFTYRAFDGSQYSSPTTVTINVGPVANPDSYSVAMAVRSYAPCGTAGQVNCHVPSPLSAPNPSDAPSE